MPKNAETVRSCWTIGDILDNRDNKPKMYKVCADKGDVNMMMLYAITVLNGDGIEVNKKEAAEYFKKAADYGDVNGMILYSQMLQEGNGIPNNKKIC